MHETTSLTGTKCARHLDMPALSVCERCGDFLCLHCLRDHDRHLYCPDCLPPQPMGPKPSTRVVAHLIDWAAVLLASWLASPMLLDYSGVAEAFVGVPIVTMAVLAMSGIVPVGMIQLALVHENGQSIGKRLMKLRVVMLNGEPVDVWRVLFLRNAAPFVLGLVPFIGIVFRIANVAALFNSDNRALHDRIAGTKVIYVAPPDGV